MKSVLGFVLLFSSSVFAMTVAKSGDITKDPRAYAKEHAEFSDQGFREFKCSECTALKKAVFVAPSSTCGTGGCEYMMFVPEGTSFKYVTTVTLAPGGFEFLKTAHKGYPDVKSYAHLSAYEGSVGVYEFNGQAYKLKGVARTVKSDALLSELKAEPVKAVQLTRDFDVIETR